MYKFECEICGKCCTPLSLSLYPWEKDLFENPFISALNLLLQYSQYHCPRCGNTKIIDYGDSFDCPLCQLEFEKKDFDTIKDKSSILSIEEKSGVTRELRKKNNSE